MATDQNMHELYDRATRGESFTAEEQVQLERWYIFQDEAEATVLGWSPARPTNTALQTRIESALSEMLVVTKRIQEIAAENDALRHEITALQLQITNRSLPQAA